MYFLIKRMLPHIATRPWPSPRKSSRLLLTPVLKHQLPTFSKLGLVVPGSRETDHLTFLKGLQNKYTFPYLVDVLFKLPFSQKSNVGVIFLSAFPGSSPSRFPLPRAVLDLAFEEHSGIPCRMCLDILPGTLPYCFYPNFTELMCFLTRFQPLFVKNMYIFMDLKLSTIF